eukprot:TRINITY_DN5024_c1_g1_i4.p1 TRINITY_DN5024_c1_g1~~TRINITY_DN5024_c1_g1_i4.p1  ORF type:complete len:100 (-),score=19.41 TRINITY_DN5024_c1_g1_i4:401-700(-)
MTRVCVFGAGGALGFTLVQILKFFLSCDITAIVSERDVERVSKKVSNVVSYTNEEGIKTLSQGNPFHVVVDVSSQKNLPSEKPLGWNICDDKCGFPANY